MNGELFEDFTITLLSIFIILLGDVAFFSWYNRQRRLERLRKLEERAGETNKTAEQKETVVSSKNNKLWYYIVAIIFFFIVGLLILDLSSSRR